MHVDFIPSFSKSIRRLSIASICLFSLNSQAKDLQIPPAAKALQAFLADSVGKTNNAVPLSAETITKKLKTISKLPEEEQINTWVEVISFCAQGKLDSMDFWKMQDELKTEIASNIPAPQHWEALTAKLLEATKDIKNTNKQRFIKLLTHQLSGNQAAFHKLLLEDPKVDQKDDEKKKGLGNVLSKLMGNSHSRQTYDPLRSIKGKYLEHFGDSEHILSHFKSELAKAEKTKLGLGYIQLSIPDLLSIVELKEAKLLLQRVVALLAKHQDSKSNLHINLSRQTETTRFLIDLLKASEKKLKKLPSALVSEINDPELINSLVDNIELYQNYDKENLLKHNISVQLRHGNVEKSKIALELFTSESRELKKLKIDPMELERMPEHLRTLVTHKIQSSIYFNLSPSNRKEKEAAFDCMLKLANEPSAALLWQYVHKYGLELKRSDEVLAIYKAKFPADTIYKLEDITVASKMADTYLALDDVATARSIRSKLISTMEDNLKKIQENPNKDGVTLNLFPISKLIELYAKEAKVCQVLEKKTEATQYRKKAFECIKKLNIADMPSAGNSLQSVEYKLKSINEELIKSGELDSALENIIYLLETKKKIKESQKNNRHHFMSHSGSLGLVSQLLDIYRQANKPNDILWLLQNLPVWEKTDLYEINNASVITNAAWALAETKQKETAYLILANGLEKGWIINKDKAYLQLLELKHKSTPALLEELARVYPFQERPIIWNAQLAVNNNEFEQAEKLAKAGIAIDPSDGEQGKDDRMRVYDVLAQALAGQGKQKEADFFHSVTRAIRLGEQADTVNYAGLTKRAIDMYLDSLNSFADAYCLQSRLAVYYSEIGEIDKAAKYYRKAFELMPSSFGRIESHCFGCEGAFRSEQAQEIATEVFNRLAVENPNHAQTHYLLGYLEDAKKNPNQAILHFRKAAELDPLYINAWKKIANAKVAPTKENIALKQSTALNLLKLSSPQDRIRNSSYLSFRLAEAYEIIKNKKTPDSKGNNSFPLNATAIQKAKQKKLDNYTSYHYFDSKITKPSDIIKSDEIFSQLIEIITNRN